MHFRHDHSLSDIFTTDYRLDERYHIKFEALDKRNKKWVRYKNYFLLIFLSMVAFSFLNVGDIGIRSIKFGELYLWKNAQSVQITIPFILKVGLITFVVTNVIAFIHHFYIATITLNDVKRDLKFGDIKIKDLKDKGQLIKSIFSPDYFWAEFFKRRIGYSISDSIMIDLETLEYTRLVKKFYIERANWLNLNLSLAASSILFILFYNSSTLYGLTPIICIFLVLNRLISRSIEILFAFYNDVVNNREKIFYSKNRSFMTFNGDVLSNNFIDLPRSQRILDLAEQRIYIHPWKNTILLSNSRTSLALHSLLELTIIYAVFYFLLSGLSHYHYLLTPPNELQEKLGVMKFLIYSISNAVTLPEIKPLNYWAIAQAFQLLPSIVLLIMSLAYYLGKDNDIPPHLKELYAISKHKKIEAKIKKLKNNYSN